MPLAVLKATATPNPRATKVLTMAAMIVQVLARSSDLRPSSTSLRFSLSATSSASVEFFTHEEASFCK